MKKTIVKRELEIETILKIIDEYTDYKEVSNNGLVILLNGQWGSGKTKFINLLEKYIEKEDKYEIILNYNAWESDFYDNAYIPFFNIIEDKFENKYSFNKLIDSSMKLAFYKTKEISYYLIKQSIFSKFNIDIDTIKDIKQQIIDEKEKSTNYLKYYKDFINIKKQVNKELTEICSTGKKKIFIIDELDRCNPKFAIETLEIIKHFFDIENCIFIIAVDKIQLEESVKTIFGQNMNAEIYFSKFFDYQFNLPNIVFSDLYTDKTEADSKILSYATEIFKELSISIRDGLKIISEFHKICKDVENITSEQSKIIMFLLTLKYTDLFAYKLILNGKTKIFKGLIDNDNNYNKYEKVIGNHDILQFLNNYVRYIDIEYIKEEIFRFNSKEKLIVERKNAAFNNLNKYIPYLRENLTYKSTIERIIN